MSKNRRQHCRAKRARIPVLLEVSESSDSVSLQTVATDSVALRSYLPMATTHARSACAQLCARLATAIECEHHANQLLPSMKQQKPCGMQKSKVHCACAGLGFEQLHADVHAAFKRALRASKFMTRRAHFGQGGCCAATDLWAMKSQGRRAWNRRRIRVRTIKDLANTRSQEC